MAFLRDWIRQIALLMIFASLTGLLVPSGQLRRYFRLVLGLVILLAVLGPLVRWSWLDLSWPGLNESLLAGPKPRPEKVTALETVLEGQVWEILRRSLEEEVARLVQDEVKKGAVSVRITREEAGPAKGSLQKVEITWRRGEKEGSGTVVQVSAAPETTSRLPARTEERIVQRVADRLGIPTARVVVRTVGE
ncbi:MAG: stage III sporulation protein AF [Firmicutes bacterium]|nr:stage III sporulation protein AF [Bacillota bacterium]MCL5039102.1 stage III sporulation protein AF [Bacillota bacterium]